MPQKKSKITVQGTNRLYRSESDRIIAGVCAGIADYFGVDSSLVRMLFITIALFGGGGILLYVVLWIMIPTELSAQKEAKKTSSPIQKNLHTWLGLGIILIGLYFLLANFGVIAWFPIGRLWPLILIVIGISMFWKRK